MTEKTVVHRETEKRRKLIYVAFSVSLLLCVLPFPPYAPLADQAAAQTPDIHFVPTTAGVIDVMLGLAEVTSADVVYDLGSGEGDIVIRAAEKYGVRGVGIEIDSRLVKKSQERARKRGVADKVTF